MTVSVAHLVSTVFLVFAHPFCRHLLTDQSDDSDKIKLVVGVVVGLMLATIIIGLSCWIYMKRSK